MLVVLAGCVCVLAGCASGRARGVCVAGCCALLAAGEGVLAGCERDGIGWISPLWLSVDTFARVNGHLVCPF